MQQAHTRIKDYLKKQFNLESQQIDSMIPGLINTLSNHMENMEKVLASGDLEQLGKAGHTMKGALLNLGLKECAEIAYDIELKGKAQDATADFEKLVASLREQLSDYIVS